MASQRPKVGGGTAVFVVVIVAIVGIMGLVSFASQSGGRAVSSSSSTSIQEETSHDPGSISISVSITPTTAGQNQTIRVTVSDVNGLTVPNELPLLGGWKVQNLSMGPCSFYTAYPYGIAVYQGRYGLGNLSSAKQIVIYAPGIYSCPSGGGNTNSFTFNPLQNASSYVDLQGYWTAGETPNQFGGFSQGVLHPFLPGEYTVVAGDEWGHVQILYFQVTTASGRTVEVVSVTGPIPPFNPGGPVVGITLRNVGDTPITSLSATLPINTQGPQLPYSFVFNVNSSNPLKPGQTAQDTRTLIGAGFDSSLQYSLTISGTLSNGIQFSYTEQVRIVPPG